MEASETRQALVQQGQALAELMTARRCYMKGDPAAHGGVTFDPRLLAFEYAFNLLLRSQQVELVDQFVGLVPQPQLDEFLRKLTASAPDP